MNPAQTERAALVQSLRAIGPDAPTLCGGWTTRDLAAHLVVRERRPDSMPGIVIKPLAGYTAKVQHDVAAEPWTELLDQIASGPPLWSPFKLVDRWANLAEMFVHHEDVLRGGAAPDAPWQPRPVDPAVASALRTPVRSMGKMALRKAPVRVTLRSEDGETLLTAGAGEGITVTGTPGELTLFLFGRAPVDLDFAGSQDAIAALNSVKRGF